MGILGFEAMIAYLDMSVIPGAMPATIILGNIFPVIGNFIQSTSASSSVAPYIALTCVLTPVKVFIAYLLIMQLSPEDKATLISFPSSNATFIRRIFSTFLVMVISAGFVWYVFSYGDAGYFNTDTPPRSAAAKYHLVSGGGIKMWIGWSVMHLAMLALFLGVLLAFVDEWLRISFNFKQIDKE